MKIKKFNENISGDDLMRTHLDDESFEHYKQVKNNIHKYIRVTLNEFSDDFDDYTQVAEGQIDLSGSIKSKMGKYTYEIKITRVE